MARNYKMIHFLQNEMEGMDNKAASMIIRMFNRLDERKIYASALSTSVTLYLALSYIGLLPKLVLGTVQYQGLSYPHAWIEMNDKVFDLAIYGDTRYHPMLTESHDVKAVLPQINVGYADTNEINYYPFQFGSTWAMADMKRLVGKTLKEYADKSPVFNIWSDVCYILELSATSGNLEKMEEIASNATINDSEA